MQDKEAPMVSIITPAYNCEKYIRYAIESVKRQTYENWEHIIINDCSTDDTDKILEKYARKDQRICVIALNKNEGVAYARNVGIKAACGRYIAFLDSDDQWKKDKLEHQIWFMQEQKVLFSYTAYDVINEQGDYQKTIMPTRMKVNYKQLLLTNIMACCTIMLKSELVKWNLMPEIKHEDYATWLTILHNNDLEAVCLPESLSLYRKVKNSVSANKWKTIGWNWNIYRNNQHLSILASLFYLLSFIVFTVIKYIRR